MRRIEMILSSACVAVTAAAVPPAIPYDPALEKEVDRIVSGMTLEQKIGQMCEVTIDVIAPDRRDAEFRADKDKLDRLMKDYFVGSVLNVPFGQAQTVDVWHRLVADVQEASMKYIGIPDIYGVDQIHGTTYTAGGTLFPQEVNMAASFNRPLVRRAGEISAYETRAGSIPWTYAPVMDLMRNPSWSRVWESFGEDVYLNGTMAAELVKGYQGDNPNDIGKYNVASCAKHYLAYGASSSGKDRTPAIVAENDLMEKYFEPFKMAVEAGALSVMVNSGHINGVPVHASHELLTGWLKDGLNWDGMIVTDWADIHNLYKRDHVAEDYKKAIEMSINAGVDMSMTPYDVEFCTLLKELVKEGRVAQSRVDDAARRIIRLKLRCNLWKMPVTDPKDYPLFGSRQHADVALELARQSEVLLKNDGVLPLDRNKKILVTGPNANSIRSLNGGWSYTWQGTDDKKYTAAYNTIFKALSNKLGEKNVVYCPGMVYDEKGHWSAEKDIDIDAAVKAASGVDVIVVCVGENSYCETPGNLDELTISEKQSDLVKALAKTGKPVVLVINSGRPRIIRGIEPLASAVVDVMLPGNYGGDALADLLAGDANFSARLPFTYPKFTNSLTTYDYKPSEFVATMDGAYNYDAKVDAQWEFGSGMSYTTYSYSNLAVDKTAFRAGETLTVTVDVKNTGDREGMEPVLLFSSDVTATSITPDIKRLRAYDKVCLKPGETKTVTFSLPVNRLAYVDSDLKWRLEAGDFILRCGGQNVKVECLETAIVE